MLKEFKEFALRGNVLDMAIGIIIGAAFGTVVSSLVNDLLMPPIGMLLGNVDFKALFIVLRDGKIPPPYGTLEEAKTAGAVTFNYGSFITNVITFLIVAFAVFLLVKGINNLSRKKAEEPPAPTTKECPFCKSKISLNASRCPHCTSELELKKI